MTIENSGIYGEELTEYKILFVFQWNFCEIGKIPVKLEKSLTFELISVVVYIGSEVYDIVYMS